MEFLENCKIRHSFSARPETAYLCILWKNRKSCYSTAQKLTVSPSRLSLKLKKTYKLKISRTPLTTVEKITYKSSNSKIASVNSQGMITARKKGTATITILSGKKKATVKVTVK